MEPHSSKTCSQSYSHQTLMLNVEYIKQVKETKLLGITIDNELTWKQHINKICIKMGGVLASVKRCASFLNQHALKLITQALLLSNLDYCPTVRSNANVELIGKLQKNPESSSTCSTEKNRANVKQMHKELVICEGPTDVFSDYFY